MSSNLRIGSIVGLLAGALFAGTCPAAEVHLHSDPSKLSWVDAPAPLHGMKIAALHGDPAKAGPFAFRLMIPDGAKIAPHWHSKDEAVTVLSGTFKVRAGERASTGETQTLKQGAFVFMPAKMPHAAEAEGQTVVQIQGEGPFDLHFVNPDDDPRKRQ